MERLIQPKERGPHWTKSDKRQVDQLLKQGATIHEISKITGRTERQIQFRAKNAKSYKSCLSCHESFYTDRHTHICSDCKKQQRQLGKSQYDAWAV